MTSQLFIVPWILVLSVQLLMRKASSDRRDLVLAVFASTCSLSVVSMMAFQVGIAWGRESERGLRAAGGLMLVLAGLLVLNMLMLALLLLLPSGKRLSKWLSIMLPHIMFSGGVLIVEIWGKTCLDYAQRHLP